MPAPAPVSAALARKLSRPTKLLRLLSLFVSPSNNPSPVPHKLYPLPSFLRPFSSQSPTKRPLPLASLRGGCYDEAAHPPPELLLCPGCGLDRHAAAWKEGKPGNVPRVVLVVTKLDLLPSAALSPNELERWALARAHVGGASKLAGVHLVSAVRNWGVRELVEHIKELVGPKGNVWAVGAQNAGKSTLINAMGRLAGGKVSHLTEAPVPGTTLGIVRVEGVLGGQAKLFDTPGILHPYQITMRLTMEEQKCSGQAQGRRAA